MKCIRCNCSGVCKGRALDDRRLYRCPTCGYIWTNGVNGRKQKHNKQLEKLNELHNSKGHRK